MRRFTRFSPGLLLGAAFGCGEDGSTPTAPSSSAAATATAVYTQVTVGARHSCALASNGRAYCWGTAVDGQLGIGPTPPLSAGTPTRVAGSLQFVQISAGHDYTCAVTADNRAYCWGENTSGQLGDGTTVSRPQPVPVAGGRRFRHIRAGGAHTCAITPFDRAFCWGQNGYGQLGDGTTTQRLEPVRVVGGLLLPKITAGWQHTCAITSGNKAYCWGRNEEGQVGNGSLTSRSRPAAVVGGLSVKQVVAGSDHTCGVTTLHKGYCWGAIVEDYNGQLGSGAPFGTPVPVPLAGTRRWRQANAGFLQSCGVTQANVAFCWGWNSYGQNGSGNTGIVVLSPTRVAGDLSFVGVAVAVHDPPPFSTSGYATHACGLTTDGRIFCWGSGYLGNGSGSTSLVPVQALPPT